MRSRLLDAGAEVVLVYPEVVEVNRRGDPLRVPSDTPVRVRVTTSVDRSSDAELPGQVSSKVVKCLARSAPVGSWARVVYAGEDWDVAYPPRLSPGVSRATRHVEFGLRSRNTTPEGP
ncbi:hypothetical protein [Arthrobacter sp. 31Y]|uniref:hypothetical protein n=1 Tax=Arthrobacter sp. 31Y TaxID=1115632 RepID=UPI000464F96D|nr:hypothetical protein [Arthrobacter sp. 31Y]